MYKFVHPFPFPPLFNSPLPPLSYFSTPFFFFPVLDVLSGLSLSVLFFPFYLSSLIFHLLSFSSTRDSLPFFYPFFSNSLQVTPFIHALPFPSFIKSFHRTIHILVLYFHFLSTPFILHSLSLHYFHYPSLSNPFSLHSLCKVVPFLILSLPFLNHSFPSFAKHFSLPTNFLLIFHRYR